MSASDTWGFDCFNKRQCKQEIGGRGERAARRRARAAGWVIGHVEGQSHYSCPGCAPALFDTHPIGLMENEERPT